MAFSLFTPKNRIVSLVLNDHSVRFLELKQTNPPIIQRWSERFLPPGIISDGKITDQESLENILEECIDEWKINRRTIRFLVPDSLVIIRKVSIPAEIQEDEIRGFLYLELGSSIHLPFDEPVFDIYPLGESRKSKEILLIAAPEKVVMEYANLFTQLRLNPIAADISPLALFRLYHQMDLSSQNETLFTIQFDLTGVSMCIFEEQIPYIMRHIPIPFEVKEWELKKNDRDIHEYKFVGNEEELSYQNKDILKEILKFLDFYRYSLNNRSKEISKFLLNGDHPFISSLFREMKEQLEAPVIMISLDDTVKGKLDDVPMKFLLPLGLALKGGQ